MKHSLSLFPFIFLSVLTWNSWAHIEFSSTLNRSLDQLDQWKSDYNRRPLKIAIIEKSFFGFSKQLSTQEKDVVQVVYSSESSKNRHGSRILKTYLSVLNQGLPSLRHLSIDLYEAANLHHFKEALDLLGKKSYDLVLYAQVWPILTDRKGQGAINESLSNLFNKNPKLIWINSSGNFEDKMITRRIASQLPKDIRIYCDKPQCHVSLGLSWSHSSISQSKDLDFFITDSKGQIVALSNKTQIAKKHSSLKIRSDRKKSFLAQEQIETQIKKGVYKVGFVNRSKNFLASDKLWLYSLGGNYKLAESQELSQSVQESLLTPADHKKAITVGASDHLQSSASKNLGKPEIIAPSTVTFIQNGRKTRVSGSSTASAVVAGVGTILLTHSDQVTRSKLIRQLTGNFKAPHSSKWFTVPKYQEIIFNDADTAKNSN